MSIRTLNLVLFSLMFFLPLPGQVLPTETKYYSQNEGLPNRTVYDVYTDARGIKWVSTVSGLSLFDGFKFFNFSNVQFTNVAQQINIRGAGKINEDAHHNLIIQPADFKDSIEVFNYHSLDSYGVSLRKNKAVEGAFVDICIMPRGKVFVLRRSSSHLLIYQWINGQNFELIQKINSTSLGKDNKDRLIADTNGDFWIFDYYQQAVILFRAGIEKKFYPFQNADFIDKQSLDFFYKSKNGTVWFSSTTSNDFSYIEATTGKIHDSELHPEYNFNQVWEDELGNLIISATDGFYSQRLILVTNENEFTDLEQILNLESKITSIRGKDFTKSFDLSSHNGFYHFTLGYEDKNISNYLNQDLQGGQFGNVMRGLANDQKGNVYLVEEGTSWYQLNTEEDQLTQLIVRDHLGKAIEKMSCGGNLIYEEGLLWGVSCDQNSNGRIHCFNIQADTWKMWMLPDEKVFPRFILKKSGTEFWVFTLHQSERNGDIYIFNKETGAFKLFEKWEQKDFTLKNTIPNFAVQDEEGIIWLGTSSGLIKMDVENQQFKKILIDEASQKGKYIATLLENKDGKLWVGTLNEGLFIFDKKSEKFSRFALKKEIGFSSNRNKNIFPNNSIAGIIRANENEYIVSTYFGLTYLNLAEGISRNYFQRDGFCNYEYNRLAHLKDEKGHLFLGGVNGFDVFKLEDLEVGKTQPTPILTRFFKYQEGAEKVNSHYDNLMFSNPLIIDPEIIAFGFDFMLPNYFNPENNSFQTYLEGWETDFNPPTNIPSVQFYKLPPGQYKLHIKGMDERGNSSIQDLVIPITVKPFFYKTWWFYLLVTFIVGGIIGRMIKQAIDRRKKIELEEIEKKEKERRFLELELKTLRLQLNPHFMFNALGAIQFYIKNNESRLAINYLADFARLMRLFLESSKHKMVLLENELELLRLYVDLEQMRFDNKFEVNYEIDEALDLGMIEIPSLLLQPFVENAINHGLRHKKSGGKLEIKMIYESTNESLICIIKDNGVGRKRAEQIKNNSLKKHKSRGTQIIEERLAAFNLSEEAKLLVEVEDVNPKLKDCGTKVTLTIPNVD